MFRIFSKEQHNAPHEAVKSVSILGIQEANPPSYEVLIKYKFGYGKKSLHTYLTTAELHEHYLMKLPKEYREKVKASIAKHSL